MSNIGQRLKLLIKKSGFTNKKFAELTNVAPNYISILIKKEEISDKFKYSIKKVIPSVNINWLETGEGDIFIDDSLNVIEYGENSIEIDKIADLILDNYDKFLQNHKFKVILDNYSSKKIIEYIKKDSNK